MEVTTAQEVVVTEDQVALVVELVEMEDQEVLEVLLLNQV